MRLVTRVDRSKSSNSNVQNRLIPQEPVTPAPRRRAARSQVIEQVRRVAGKEDPFHTSSPLARNQK